MKFTFPGNQLFHFAILDAIRRTFGVYQCTQVNTFSDKFFPMPKKTLVSKIYIIFFKNIQARIRIVFHPNIILHLLIAQNKHIHHGIVPRPHHCNTQLIQDGWNGRYFDQDDTGRSHGFQLVFYKRVARNHKQSFYTFVDFDCNIHIYHNQYQHPSNLSTRIW